MNDPASEPIGVVLAGGRGRRLGGAKTTVELAGVPLLHYPVLAMLAALPTVAVLAKPDTPLPPLSGVERWEEAEPDHHPLVGLLEALRLAGGRPVMVCAGDLPLVTAQLISTIARTPHQGRPAVVARAGGRLQPLLGCYQPEAAELLARTRRRADVPLIEAVSELEPLVRDVPDPDLLFNVNTPQDLLAAGTLLHNQPSALG